MLSRDKDQDAVVLGIPDVDVVSQRYIAGSQFFNYESFGALREGGPIRLLSKQYIGLAVSVFFTNFVFCILRSCVSPTLSNLLKLTPAQTNAAQHLIEDLPVCLSFFVGFMSDCVPIRGYQRKPYMVLGWMWAATTLSAMTVLMWLCNTSLSSNVYILLAMSVSFGTMIPFVMAEIMLAQLSQRESLQERGSLVARYQFVRILGSTTGKLATLVLVQDPSLAQIQGVLTMLSLASLIPPIAIELFLVEQRVSSHLTVKQACQNVRKTAQQKVVWKIVVFVIIFTFFLNFEFPTSETAIRTWCEVNDSGSKVVTVLVQNISAASAILAWQLRGLTLEWPVLFLLSPVLKFVPSLLLESLTTSDTWRSPFLFWFMSCIAGFSHGLARISLPIVLTEIVDSGNEGTTVGLMLTFQKTLTMFVTTMAPKISTSSGWDVTSNMIKSDTNEVRSVIRKSLTVSYVINLFSILGLFFLPTQKLDAQQLRTYGGFTRHTSTVLLVAFLAFFTYSLMVNVSGAYTSHSSWKWS